jgi:hypothetical protein
VTPGNLELLEVLVSWAVVLPGGAAVLVLDERRLRGPQLARAWPVGSRDAALFAVFNFPVLLLVVLPLHFWRTRRSLLGTLAGVGWVAALVAVDVGAQLALGAAVDWLGL